MITFLLLSILTYSDQTNEDKLRKAGTHIIRELWSQSDLQLQAKQYAKLKYKNLTTKEEREILGVAIGITKIILDKEIKYEYKF